MKIVEKEFGAKPKRNKKHDPSNKFLKILNMGSMYLKEYGMEILYFSESIKVIWKLNSIFTSQLTLVTWGLTKVYFISYRGL